MRSGRTDPRRPDVRRARPGRPPDRGTLGGMEFVIRPATDADLPALRPLIAAATAELLRPFLTPGQVESSRAIMGLDTQLIADGPYYVVRSGDAYAGCGGWGRRATLYGGDHSAGRDAALLDPSREPARI